MATTFYLIDDADGAFTLVSNQIRVLDSSKLDVTISPTLTIRVRAISDAGQVFEKDIVIDITNFAPADISISGGTVPENEPIGTYVGTLSAVDEHPGTVTYSLVAGTGDTDNAKFSISTNQLLTASILNYEAGTPLSTRIRATDFRGNTFDKIIFVVVTNVPEAPTDITLSNLSIDEGMSINSIVGTLTSSDVDSTEFTYSLPSYADNASFNISGNQLRSSNVFNYETKNSYSIRIRTTDSNSLYFEKDFTIQINNVNEAPYDITLSNSSLDENLSTDSVIGNIVGSDPDLLDSMVFTLPGYMDNSSFNIEETSLRSNEIFNYEVKNSYSIRIRATDLGGLYFEKDFTISINQVNEPPTDMTLSNLNINEGNSINDVIGTIATVDPDVGDTYTYTLPTYGDNASFNISGSSLRASIVFDYQTKSSYSIRIRSTDLGGLYVEKDFIITVVSVNFAPTDISISNNDIDEGLPINTVIGTISGVDPDAGDTLIFSLPTYGDNASFNISGTDLRSSSIFTYATKSSYSIRIRATDLGGLYYEKDFTIYVNQLAVSVPLVIDNFNNIETFNMSVMP